MSILHPLWFVVVACTGGSENPTPTGDTGSETDTTLDSSPTADRSPTETGTSLPETAQITLDITKGDWTGMGASITPILLDGTVDGPVLASSVVAEDRVTFTVERPPAASLEAFSPDDPSVLGQVFLPALFDDPNGNGVAEPGEIYTGLSIALLVWLQGDNEVPDELASLGIGFGWTAVILLGDITVNPSLAGIPITVAERRDQLTLTGSYAGAEERRLAVVPAADPFGQNVNALLADEPLSKTFSITFDGEPPVDHHFVDDALVPDGTAIEAPISYVDTNQDGALDGGDSLSETVCNPSTGRVLSAVWFPRTDNLTLAYGLGGQWGWVAMHIDGTLQSYATDTVDGLIVGVCKAP